MGLQHVHARGDLQVATHHIPGCFCTILLHVYDDDMTDVTKHGHHEASPCDSLIRVFMSFTLLSYGDVSLKKIG